MTIETPKKSRNKYAFDEDEKTFTLKKVLPAGMAFPYDFGFVPSTEAEDGDPIDVLVLMDEPAFPGCAIKEGEQGNGKKTERNDRMVAVENANHQWADIDHVDDLGKEFVKELEEFFVRISRTPSYPSLSLSSQAPRAWTAELSLKSPEAATILKQWLCWVRTSPNRHRGNSSAINRQRNVPSHIQYAVECGDVKRFAPPTPGTPPSCLIRMRSFSDVNLHLLGF